MNRRIKKKKWNYYVGGNHRYGCEECLGAAARILKDEDGWIMNLSLELEKVNKKWKLKLMQKDAVTKEREEFGYIEPKYCWNCGRKLK